MESKHSASGMTEVSASESARLRSGVTLRYVEQGRGASPTLIFLHGYTDSSVSFAGLLERLGPSVHAITPDQRGHGESTRTEGSYTMERLADDVIELMDGVGVRSAALVGHSMGGLVAQLAAARHPDRVDGLVLIATSAAFRSPAVQELVAAVRQLEDPVDPAFAREFQAGTTYRPLPNQELDRYVAESLKLPAATWKALVEGLAATDLTLRLGEIRCPTLVIWGDRDGVVLRIEQEVLANGIRGAQLKVYEEVGHAVHWEAPERVVADLNGFVSGALTRRPDRPARGR